MRPSKANLKKLEAFYKDIGYRVRYGKGYFQAGYCLNAEQKHIIVNKMYTDVAKFNLLKELVSDVEVDPETMSEEKYILYHKLLPKKGKGDDKEADKEVEKSGKESVKVAKKETETAVETTTEDKKND